MKRGTPDHPKTRRLARALKVNQAWAVGILEALWHFSGRFAQQGNIGQHEDIDIAQAVYWTREPEILINALVECGWLERHDTHRLIVHDWHEHADDAVRKYLERHNLPFETQSGQCRDTVETRSGQCTPNVRLPLPVPVPLPLPVPEPVPEPEPKPDADTYSAHSRVALHYLNDKSGRSYRETESSLAPINARLQEPDVTIEGVKQMIDRQCALWLHDPKMCEYLRPQTLFNPTKFNAYYAAKDLPVVNGKVATPMPNESF